MTGMKRALAASAASLALVAAGVAHGEVFDLKNGPPGCGCGATGAITVTADGTALDGDPTFKVVVDITSGAFNLAGNGFDATGFDLDGITTANISLVSAVGGGGLADFSVVSPQTAASNMEDGTGDWDFVVSHIKGNNSGPNPTGLTYLVSAPGLTINDFISNGTGGSFFVDVIGPTGKTGVQGTGAGFPGVPEPATWAMMLMGVFGLGGLLRRRRQLALA